MSKKPKKLTTDQITKIKELHTTGLSSYAIAKKMGIPAGVARYHINRERLSQLEGSMVNKLQTYEDPTAINLLKQQIDRLDQKKRLLQEIIDQGFE